MFTGIIEETGTLCEIKKGGMSAQIRIRCQKILEGTKIGDSISVNGICLTVTSLGTDSFTADVMAIWNGPWLPTAGLADILFLVI